MKLALANLNQFGTSLHKGFDGCEDRIGDEVPLPGISGVDYISKSIINLPPSLPALNGIVQIFNTLLDVSIKHVVNVDLGLASLDYLI